MIKTSNWMIVSRSQLLNDLLDFRWPQELLVKLSTTHPGGMVKILASEPISLILFDLSTIDIQQAYQLQRFIEREYSATHTVFLNFPRHLDTTFLIHPATTAGVFYRDASLATISHGLDEILEGGSVIPQDLCQSVTNIDNDDSD
ncbi:DNA-binding response regulator, partial [Shewanella sp. SG41-4]|uniref:DNA-binding response regulator n=1 Tax=Shewanella sp. SG41-4 TaxID=2760976 RepID=UPI0016035102